MMQSSPARPMVTTHANVQVSALTEEEFVRILMGDDSTSLLGKNRLVVTPNMHHLALLQVSAELGAAYDKADVVLADGWPVVRLARRLGVPLTERATGSGIVARLARTAGGGRHIAVIGGSTPEATQIAANIFAANGWRVTSAQAPVGWSSDRGKIEEFAERIASADLVLIGIGTPKQEVVATSLMDLIGASGHATFLCVGASIDFIAGETRRAPRWMQKLGLEWLHRILSDPARLARRYARDVIPFVRVWRESVRRAGEPSGDY